MNDIGNDIHALSGAYALDALSETERRAFEDHLDGCASCRDEVASLQETAALLPATTETAPPASLRASVLDAITSVRPLPPILGPETEPENDSEAESDAEPEAEDLPAPTPLRRRWVRTDAGRRRRCGRGGRGRRHRDQRVGRRLAIPRAAQRRTR